MALLVCTGRAPSHHGNGGLAADSCPLAPQCQHSDLACPCHTGTAREASVPAGDTRSRGTHVFPPGFLERVGLFQPAGLISELLYTFFHFLVFG